ncbi:G-rich domain on putative tyrosine kinase [Desulfonispora thiosulfatigenes DSM 11270]|uniref:G-rich domain on putative tyrosine kinase n=1 Tax=Desulfonispora thiosulfatigenes DSM 11270 TaxID=656914 RepID=A0A1W1V622_DESTI|nr:GNVR domain-containing protein [Desulfonispora thiosulfatigenes]SMB88511.1 G-rich domain on putative tyrosine kinase [Desulfonispora thiosulfatigenes DSM 11270]
MKINILSIKVKDRDPKQAANIANSLATKFSGFISELATKQTNQSLTYIQTQLEIEEKNLKEVLAQYRTELAKAGVDDQNIQKAAADKQVELEMIDLKVENARNKFKALLAKKEEIKLAQSFDIGEAAIVVSSKAYESKSPVSPNKTLNVAIALVLGLMIGVFAAFAKSYWQSTSMEGKGAKV